MSKNENLMQSNARPQFWWIAYDINKQPLCTDEDWAINPEMRERIKYVELFYDGKHRVIVDCSQDGQRLILVKRVQFDTNQDLKIINEKRFIWLVGWQTTVNGVNVKSIIFAYPDGTLTMQTNDGRT